MKKVLGQGSTVFLRVVVISTGLVMLALCAVGVPLAIGSDKTDYYRPLLFGLYVPAIPFFYALYQTLHLLGYIDTDKAFSELSVAALRRIKHCAAVVGGLFALGMPYIFHVADKDDAPGVAAIGCVIIGASVVIAVFAAVLQKLLQRAMVIKSENDLTV